MNDKDKEAFDSWELDYFGTAKEENCPHYMIHIKKAWQAACEYKQKELEKKLEIAVEALEFYGEINNSLTVHEDHEDPEDFLLLSYIHDRQTRKRST